MIDYAELQVSHEFDGLWSPFSVAQINPNHPPRDQQRWEALRASMGEKGWVGRPIMVMARAWCASHRIQVAKELGMEKVPVIWVPGDFREKVTGFNPDEPSERYAHARTAYGDKHPLTMALRIEQGIGQS